MERIQEHVMPDGNKYLVEEFVHPGTGWDSQIQFPIRYFRSLGSFCCLVDAKGFIWITGTISKEDQRISFFRPCMRYCYHEIYFHNHAVAKAVLSLSCEIQNDKDINYRAAMYKS